MWNKPGGSPRPHLFEKSGWAGDNMSFCGAMIVWEWEDGTTLERRCTMPQHDKSHVKVTTSAELRDTVPQSELRYTRTDMRAAFVAGESFTQSKWMGYDAPSFLSWIPGYVPLAERLATMGESQRRQKADAALRERLGAASADLKEKGLAEKSGPERVQDAINRAGGTSPTVEGWG